MFQILLVRQLKIDRFRHIQVFRLFSDICVHDSESEKSEKSDFFQMFIISFTKFSDSDFSDFFRFFRLFQMCFRFLICFLISQMLSKFDQI